jgi:hypothetical protein
MLVAKMAAANPLWGAPRIHGELCKLGLEVSERTVSRVLARRPRPRSQTWRIFLANHVAGLVSMDFFTVSTLTGRVRFVLVPLAHPATSGTPHRRPRAPDVRLDDAASDRRVSRGCRSPVVAERPLTASTATPSVGGWQAWDHGRRLQPHESMAKSIRRAPDRIHPPRMSRSCDGHQRRPSASHPSFVTCHYHRSARISGSRKTPDHRPVSEKATGHVVAIPQVGGLHDRYEWRAA